MENNPPPLPSRTPSWFKKNWKWLLAGFLALGLCLFAFATAIVFSILGVMKHSDVYQQALQQVRADAGSLQELGSPIKDGLFFSGNINVHNSSGNANLAIPLSGPKGEGTLYVVANKESGQWNYERLTLKLSSSGREIDLLAGEQKVGR